MGYLSNLLPVLNFSKHANIFLLLQSSDDSSGFGAATKTSSSVAAAENERLAEVNRKLAAMEKEDDTLKALRKSPNTKSLKSKPADDVDHYDSIDEILSDSDSVTSDDGLSVGGEDSASDSFLNESDSRGFLPDTSRGSVAAKSNKSNITGRGNTSSNNSLASSIEFSVTEHEVSGSNTGLDDVDFSARALPPVRGTRSGW